MGLAREKSFTESGRALDTDPAFRGRQPVADPLGRERNGMAISRPTTMTGYAMSRMANQMAESASTGTANTNGNAWSSLVPVHRRGSHGGT